jgi:membrane protease YdiL (CAAX protease family)
MAQPNRRALVKLTAGDRLLQVLGLLGTSQLLAALAKRAPGWATSRLADALAPIDGEGEAGLCMLIARDAIGTATLEELVFRGALFEGLRRALGLGPAIAGSAVLFGLAHLDLHHGLAAAVLGLQLGALRALFGLPLAIVAHVTNNLAALLATRAGFEASALSLAIAAGLACSACAVLAQRLRHPAAPPS